MGVISDRSESDRLFIVRVRVNGSVLGRTKLIFREGWDL